MKHIRGPNPKYFTICVMMTMFLLALPASAAVNSGSNSNFSSDLALNSRSADLSAGTGLKAVVNDRLEGAIIGLARNSVWRYSHLNALNENSRTYYMNTTTDAFAIIPRKTTLPLLN